MNWLRDANSTVLAIAGIILMGCLALIVALIVVLATKDPEQIKAGLIIGAIAGSAVTGLIGFIGGLAVGRLPVPSKPTGEVTN